MQEKGREYRKLYEGAQNERTKAKTFVAIEHVGNNASHEEAQRQLQTTQQKCTKAEQQLAKEQQQVKTVQARLTFKRDQLEGVQTQLNKSQKSIQALNVE